MGFYGKPDGTVAHISTGKPLWGSVPPKHALPPCPGCRAQPGSDAGPILWYVGASNRSHGWRVLCRSCGLLIGGLQKTEQEAITTWKEGKQ